MIWGVVSDARVSGHPTVEGSQNQPSLTLHEATLCLSMT